MLLYTLHSRGRIYDAYVGYQYGGILFYVNEMTEDDVVWLEDVGDKEFVLEFEYLSCPQSGLEFRKVEDMCHIVNPG